MLGNSPSAEMKEYVGMNGYELKEHINSRMLPGMTWNNYGKDWVVEHLVALVYFDLTNKEDIKLAWNPINLIPFFKRDMYFKEGNLHFSLELLEGLPQSIIRDKLLSIVKENLKIFEIYYTAYANTQYYDPLK